MFSSKNATIKILRKKQVTAESRFYVSATEIKANNYDLSISRYKEIEYEEIRYEMPEVIIEKIEELEERILVQYFTNWIRKSSSFIPISKYFSVKCLKS